MNSERICENCGGSFVPKHWKRPGRFCSLACYHRSGAPRGQKTEVRGPRMRTANGHPIAPPSGVVAVARLVLYDKIGPGEHQCHWCGAAVRWIAGGGPATPNSLLADHLNWDRLDDSPENLVPSCNSCNAHRTRNGDRRRIKDGELTVLKGGTRTRAVQRNCEHCGEEFLTAPAEVKTGRGRFCSRSCARKAAVPRKRKQP